MEPFFYRFPQDNLQPDRRNLFLVMPRALGDVLIATGLFKGLREKHPGMRLYMLTEAANFGILKGNALLDGVGEYRRTRRTFEERGMILYNPYIATQRVANWWEKGRTLYQIYADYCGVAWDTPCIQQQEAEITDLPSRFITLHGFTKNDAKKYSRFPEVLAGLDLPVIQIGGRRDRPIRGVARNLCGRLNVNQTAWLIARADCHLGIDSFPGHVAATVGTPAVILFGGTSAELCRPFRLATAITPPPDKTCAVACHRPKCTVQKKKCIDYIQPEAVLAALQTVLD